MRLPVRSTRSSWSLYCLAAMSLDVTQERLEPNTQSIAPGRNELSACHRFCSTPELIFLCFELAPLQTVVNYQRVCKSWYSIVSSSDILQHRLNHNEYGLALNGRQQLVLQHQIDTLILRCREDPCIGYVRGCMSCMVAALKIGLVGAAHTGRRRLLRQESSLAHYKSAQRMADSVAVASQRSLGR